jgi:pimeloyl-ACP methyl ester carboxylesterase
MWTPFHELLGRAFSLPAPFLRLAVVLWLCSSVLGAQAAPEEAYATVPGARLFYQDTGGSGVPVVFLHAATGSSRVWKYQIPAFTKAGYRVIAFDRRGWGRTQIDSGAPQPSAAADDLLALLDHLGILRVHLIGTAAGGFVALDFALSFPQRLRSVVIANSIGGVQDQDYA